MFRQKKILWGVSGLALVVAFIVYRPQIFVPLEDRLVSENDFVRNTAYSKFGKLSPSKQEKLIPGLVIHANAADWQTRRYALYSLRSISKPTEEVLFTLKKALADKEKKVRIEALIAVLNMGQKGIDLIIPKLHTLEPDEKESFLKRIKFIANDILPAIKLGLTHPNKQHRVNTLLLISQAPEMAASLAPQLKPLLKDKDYSVRSEVALLLGQSVPSREVAPILYEIIKREGWAPRAYQALSGLETLGPKASSVRSRLNNSMLTAPDGYGKRKYPRPEIAKALYAIDKRTKQIDSLEWGLKKDDPKLRYRSAVILSEVSPPPFGSASHLIKAIDDKDTFVSARVIYALSRIDVNKMQRHHGKLKKLIKKNMNRIKANAAIEGFEPLALKFLSQLGE